ncbi:MAG: ATP-dependent helicase, partial [Candidatus Pacebacteria bacterium]|nr:ATP-dependent helicase [Candidatus Paceibacterota bacterium]
MSIFDIECKKLNKAQSEAVDTIDGPVMVIAGPGTGKTQVLALRIANILTKTDTTASGILSLTFTRAGVRAMRERLAKYIGNTAHDVRISTFHSFAADIVEKHFEVLDVFEAVPKLLDDKEAVFLVDELLHTHNWEHLRPRGNPAASFNDLKSIISLLKRERMSPEDFLTEVDGDITRIEQDPDNISSRGESKGKLKKEAEKKIESLARTREVVKFYELYEQAKIAQGLMDYDDVLEYAVKIVEISDDARDEIREQFLYVLVDEHQDSSGVQNSFLRAVWADVEQPNIFVVGDDRQLIYGFGGASLSYFEEFKTAFGRAHLITLTENYRSTAPILSLADTLLASTLAQGKLTSNRDETHKIALSEYEYPRDEIIGAGLWFKEQVARGKQVNDLALLVPKNRNVRTAISILQNLGLSVSGGNNISFFDASETDMFRRVLSIIVDPFNTVALSKSLFDSISHIPPIQVHTFLRSSDTRKLSVESITRQDLSIGLFPNPVAEWGKKLASFIELSNKESLTSLVAHIGNALLIDTATDHDELVRRAEVVRTMIHLAEMRAEKHPHETLSEFLDYLARLESYGTHIPIATIGGTTGIQVMTLHASKGLEFDAVWIAHMNEEVVMSGKRIGFTLPERVDEKIEAKDMAVARREIYVAITRAREYCAISYAKADYKGSERSLARVLAEIDQEHFVVQTVDDTTKHILSHGVEMYTKQEKIIPEESKKSLIELVQKQYDKTKVSVTLLNNFFECPWKWYFRNFLQLPDVKTESLIFGSAVHKALETVIKSEKKFTRTSKTGGPSEAIITKIIEEALQREGLADERRLRTLVREGTDVVMRYIDESFASLAENRTSERSVSARDTEYPHLTLYGKIDLTERGLDDVVSVTDFKTGSSKTTGVIEKIDDDDRLSQYLRQLAMYSYLIGLAERNTSVETSKLYFLEADKKDKNRIYQIHITAEHIDLL